MKEFALSTPAKEDLTAIIEYLLDNVSPDQALGIVEKIEEAMGKLAENPAIGHERCDLAKEPLRFWLVQPYMIIYRPGTSPLEIVRVLHSARDIEKLL